MEPEFCGLQFQIPASAFRRKNRSSFRAVHAGRRIHHSAIRGFWSRFRRLPSIWSSSWEDVSGRRANSGSELLFSSLPDSELVESSYAKRNFKSST